jgi:hypothetical protein
MVYKGNTLLEALGLLLACFWNGAISHPRASNKENTVIIICVDDRTKSKLRARLLS